MSRLRTVSPTSRGWSRRRTGRGFRYVDSTGTPLDAVSVARIRALVIPPAWQDVWICPYPNGHIQAVGTDARGRRQYLYHPDWRVQRDLAKHDRVLQVARRLPAARTQVAEQLGLDGMPLERALATAFYLLDLGYFRIGSDSYTTENGSYGLTTLQRRHVQRRRGRLLFEFVAKSGIPQHIEITHPGVLSSVETMRRRRGSDEVLLAYRAGKSWSRIDAADVNEYLKDLLGDEMTAKDFRTWHGTVHAAAALGRLRADTERARKRAIAAAMREVADHLGNTPAVARSSYVDGRVIDLYSSGASIAQAIARIDRWPADDPRRQEALEQAVLRLLKT
jgi:DNA topoisomerase IB